ncbi:uncharacterized protein LOC119443974 isoform X2 [Dermacentor silvarum]|uniref:uncharacterized protein LOC119443974 isoform X2 n=1 Tax=Dermacentor silvarum TaxID=543639 RepID=UPI002100F16B|nr:uncharacterized protein LOC119443974 isoform X2 [Dermacentor silvarum]
MTKIPFPRNKGQTTPSRGRRKQKCTRDTKRTESDRKSCRYRCLGQPKKLEMEPDGTPCRPSPRRRGFCFNGRCRKKYPETKPPQVPSTLTPDQESSVLPLNCSHHKKKTTNDDAVRTCSFMCKTGKAHVLVIEEKGTPCVGSRGKRGICIGKICRTHRAVATLSAASGNWSEDAEITRKNNPGGLLQLNIL